MSCRQIVIFAGPSLPDRVSARQRLAGDYRRPAAQGDLVRAALRRPPAIVLIDGYFERVPAVYHKEILWALDQGIPVYGAASMGALRAAELHPFGMIGVGAIFEAFASGALTRDDEVALIHAPGDAGYKMLSEPLVNIRWTLAAAVEAGVIGHALSKRLVVSASIRFYPERSFAALLEESVAAPDAAAIGRLAVWLETGRIDQKQRDAFACLDRVAADQAEGTPKGARNFSFNHTDAFERLLKEIADDPAAGSVGVNPDCETLERLRAVSPESYAALQAEAVIEALALRLDRHIDQPLPKDALASEVAEFRAKNAVADPEALRQWMAARGFDIDTLSKRLEELARIARARKMVDRDISARMLNKLKIAGPYRNNDGAR